MDLLLKLAVNLVEHLKADQLIANLELVAILQHGLIDPFAVEDSSVGRVEVLQAVSRRASPGIVLGNDTSMQARGARVVDAYVGGERAAQSYLRSFQRNLHRKQFPAQEDQCGPAFTRPLILARVCIV